MIPMRKFLLILTLIAGCSFSGNAQFTTDTVSPYIAVSNYLVGPGIISNSVSFNGGIGSQIASYTYSGSAFPLDTGIMLTTGNFRMQNLDSNTTTSSSFDVGVPGITALDSLCGAITYDGVQLSFNFTPQQNTLSVTYVFGSEEYEEYVGAGFNDVFAFFLSGPDPAGGNYVNENIALIPNTTTPVSINNVNQNTNAAYYTSNVNATLPIAMDGFTVPLNATAPVIPGQTYHIRLALADAGDAIYDSWVFLGFRQFRSMQTTMGVEPVDPNSWYLYPSGNGQLMVATDASLQGWQLDIVDMTGRVHYQQQLNSGNAWMNMEALSSGIYLARISNGSQAAVKKFIWP